MSDSTMSLSEMIELNRKELFSEIDHYLEDDTITDIEWDGTRLWLTKLGKGCFPVDDRLSDIFVTNLGIRLSNIMKTRFNDEFPILEAHTENLRISIFHPSRSGKASITVRKIPTSLRYDHNIIVETKMMPEELLNLLENCIKAHCNLVIGGRPGDGKTELLKYLSGYIPANEKVITLEDNAEIHYREIHPTRKHTPFIVDDKITYAHAIKACLRHDVDWLLLSEARGPEVVELLNALSTGAYCMTTIHTDSVKDIPDRMYNMLGDAGESARFINNIYRYIDIGLTIKADRYENRIIGELGFFTRGPVTKIDKDGHEYTAIDNIYTSFYNSFEGMKPKESLPKNILRAFSKVGITDPFSKPEEPTDIVWREKEKIDEFSYKD